MPSLSRWPRREQRPARPQPPPTAAATAAACVGGAGAGNGSGTQEPRPRSSRARTKRRSAARTPAGAEREEIQTALRLRHFAATACCMADRRRHRAGTPVQRHGARAGLREPARFAAFTAWPPRRTSRLARVALARRSARRRRAPATAARPGWRWRRPMSMAIRRDHQGARDPRGWRRPPSVKRRLLARGPRRHDVTPYIDPPAGYNEIDLQTFHPGARTSRTSNFQTPADAEYEGLGAILAVPARRSDRPPRAVSDRHHCIGPQRSRSRLRDLPPATPHGVAGATAAGVPGAHGPIYFNEYVIPDSSETETSEDGGNRLDPWYQPVPTGSSPSPSTRFADFIATCADGRIINANPPWGATS